MECNSLPAHHTSDVNNCCDVVTVQRARKVRSKATSRKVKSKEIVDDVASDESVKDKNSTDVKRKRPRDNKTKVSSVDKDSKPHRKRQTTKNKVCGKHIL